MQQVRLTTNANAVTATTGGMVRAAPTKSRSLRAISAPVRQSATTITTKSPALQKAKISTASPHSMRQKEPAQTRIFLSMIPLKTSPPFSTTISDLNGSRIYHLNLLIHRKRLLTTAKTLNTAVTATGVCRIKTSSSLCMIILNSI